MEQKSIKEQLVELGKVSLIDNIIAFVGIVAYFATYSFVGIILYEANPRLALTAAGLYATFKIFGYITTRTVSERYKKMEALILSDMESKWLQKEQPSDDPDGGAGAGQA